MGPDSPPDDNKGEGKEIFKWTNENNYTVHNGAESQSRVALLLRKVLNHTTVPIKVPAANPAENKWRFFLLRILK